MTGRSVRPKRLLRSESLEAPPMTDPKTHHRFLSYRERHVYFGRDSLREPLSFSEYAALDVERLALLRTPARTAEQEARLREVLRLMLED